MSSGLNYSAIVSLIPASDSTSWIAPWVSGVLEEVQAGENPYSKAIEVISDVYYPNVVSGFKPQLWFLLGLFALSILIILLGLVLRLRQGRFWLVHRIDSTIVIPNISTIYGICALAYAALGILTVVTAVRIADREAFPRYWVGLQAGWIGPLWTGIYCECWATFCAWYIRKKGAFYKESGFKTFVAITLPFFLPLLAWVPPIALFYITASWFNKGYRTSLVMIDKLEVLQAKWTPEEGLDFASLLSFFPLGADFGGAFIKYYRFARAGYIYVSVGLAVTFVVYIIGATLEIAHLNKTIAKLREQAKLTPRARPVAAFPETPALNAQLDEQLEEEMYAGHRRQWTLLEWARDNRIYSAVAIGLMLLVNCALAAWLGATPINITTNSAQFQVEILVACWLNGILSTVVSLLILFRSLDGSSPTVSTLRRYLPFLPLPPAISRTHPSMATQTANPKGTTGLASKFDEPPQYPGAAGGFGRGGASSPIMEERKTPRPGSPTESLKDEEYAMGDKAWFGLGVTGGGRDEQGLHVVLEMQETASQLRYHSPIAGGSSSYSPPPPPQTPIPPTPTEEKHEPEFEFEEPPRHGYSSGGGLSGGDEFELPYREHHHHFAEDEHDAEAGAARGRQDSWAAVERDARRDSWE
ncbi:hypothetical protein JCM6882_000504 [Rhodosporidiobolus microsporus]